VTVAVCLPADVLWEASTLIGISLLWTAQACARVMQHLVLIVHRYALPQHSPEAGLHHAAADSPLTGQAAKDNLHTLSVGQQLRRTCRAVRHTAPCLLWFGRAALEKDRAHATHSDVQQSLGSGAAMNSHVMSSRANHTASSRCRVSRRALRVVAKVVRKEGEPRIIRGKCFVTKDVRVCCCTFRAHTPLTVTLPQNIDTDQIIPAEYLTLVPSKVRAAFIASSTPSATITAASQPDEYEKLGSYALIGLPDAEYPIRYTYECGCFNWQSVQLCHVVRTIQHSCVVGSSTPHPTVTRALSTICTRTNAVTCSYPHVG
jgi:hypothetical protein